MKEGGAGWGGGGGARGWVERKGKEGERQLGVKRSGFGEPQPPLPLPPKGNPLY